MLEMWYTDKRGFYFQTTDLKDISRQLINNKNVEGVYYLPDTNPMNMKMIRVKGEAEILPNEKYEKKVYKDRPWLKDIEKQLEAAGVKGNLFIFRIPAGEIRVFDMSYNCRESEIPVIKFGGAE